MATAATAAAAGFLVYLFLSWSWPFGSSLGAGMHRGFPSLFLHFYAFVRLRCLPFAQVLAMSLGSGDW
ncbi:hypothetical protein DACRYDRAFT_21079 [Dacryopinax primogenitus]|uniref:Uncharacterized protein n=1 Tax=Dacryopinax primogenitus (strain DJM 731) TaxID=1858805 RepID=M5FZR7_DACPD|nr:uncharacterized protein DACRYDRAFT_21079 [Dacryopinax primogenitus]EJU03516.1 hypothetical protein DACRYDRAFT_21079 [Dacryopinax primogenitus]